MESEMKSNEIQMIIISPYHILLSFARFPLFTLFFTKFSLILIIVVSCLHTELAHSSCQHMISS